jgi:16S rRNA processing protein RimM
MSFGKGRKGLVKSSVTAPGETVVGSEVERPQQELVTIARITRPHGLRGEVIADILTDFPDRFADLDDVLLRLASGRLITIRLENAWPHNGRIVLGFVGIDRIEDTEPLRGASVMIERDQLIPLPPDTYYDFDLVDCQVLTTQGEMVGKVIGVQHFGAAPLLVVVTPESLEHMIPLAATICVEVDVDRKRIVVDPPEGLLDRPPAAGAG